MQLSHQKCDCADGWSWLGGSHQTPVCICSRLFSVQDTASCLPEIFLFQLHFPKFNFSGVFNLVIEIFFFFGVKVLESLLWV